MTGVDLFQDRSESLGASQEMRDILTEDGYELLMETRSKDFGKLTIYDNDKNFALVGSFGDLPAMIITRGKPDEKYISVLTASNGEGLLDLLQNGGPFDL